MIKVYTGHLLIREGDGQRTFSSDDLCRLLRECCAVVGFHEEWLADHITLNVEEYLLESRSVSDPQPTRARVDSLVVAALTDAGYADVAAEYGRRRHLPPSGPTHDPRPWDEVRVRHVLRAGVPVAPERLDDLAATVCLRLGVLGFASVTDDLVREVGRHALPLLSRPGDERPPTAPGWILPPGYWQGRLAGPGAEYLRRGILTVAPVSRCLPSVRLSLDLPELGRGLGEGPLTELAFLPLLAACCRGAHQTARTVRDEVFRRLGHQALCLTHLRLCGVRRLVREQFPRRGRAADLELTREITAVAVREMTAEPTPPPGLRLTVVD